MPLKENAEERDIDEKPELKNGEQIGGSTEPGTEPGLIWVSIEKIAKCPPARMPRVVKI